MVDRGAEAEDCLSGERWCGLRDFSVRRAMFIDWLERCGDVPLFGMDGVVCCVGRVEAAAEGK